jgi:hypothetical protein
MRRRDFITLVAAQVLPRERSSDTYAPQQFELAPFNI